jgi:hypothetical protein
MNVPACVVCGVPLRPTVSRLHHRKDSGTATTEDRKDQKLTLVQNISAMGGATRDHWMNPCLIRATPKYLQWQKEDAESNRSAAARRVNDDKLLTVIPSTQLEFFGTGDTFYEANPEQDGRADGRLYRLDTTKFPVNIPIHADCLVVVKEFREYQRKFDIDFRAPDGAEPTYLTHFYEIWCNRAIATWPYGVLHGPIKENHNYLGVPETSSIADWVAQLNTMPPSLHPLHTSPLETSGLTLGLLQYLRPLPKGSFMPPHIAEIDAHMEKLPSELYQNCIDALEPFENPSLECSRILPPTWWRDQLRYGRIIPWLWDLLWPEIDRTLTFIDNVKTIRRAVQSAHGSDTTLRSILNKIRHAGTDGTGDAVLIVVSDEAADPSDASRSVQDSFDILDAYDHDDITEDRESSIAQGNSSTEYDWEFFVRQLAQHDVLEPTGILGNHGSQTLRNALWNRHRIWKLLSSTRLGHINWSIPDPDEEES